MKRVHVVVRGRVQGVFFRATVERAAISRGVAGWVRNNPDGTVEAVFEGGEEAIRRLLALCREGPRGARVEEVSISEEEPRGAVGFEVH
jgi:acylphosphatase